MILHNLELETLNVNALKADIAAEIDDEAVPTEQQAKDALADLYQQASAATTPLYYHNVAAVNEFKAANFSTSLAGESLWEKLRKFFCSALNAGSTVDDIITAVLDFVATYIPGGIVIKLLVKAIIKYLINRGYTALCPVD